MCQVGDGIGGTEKKLDGLYTIPECLDAVRLYFPSANGVTSQNPCPSKCKCYAEYGMTGWNSNRNWQSCMLGKYTKCRYHSRNHIRISIFKTIYILISCNCYA